MPGGYPRMVRPGDPHQNGFARVVSVGFDMHEPQAYGARAAISRRISVVTEAATRDLRGPELRRVLRTDRRGAVVRRVCRFRLPDRYRARR